MSRKFALLVVIAIGITLTTCSSASSPKPLEITMEMSEFAFNPENLEFQVGQEVTIHLVNVGALGHEIMFGRDVEMEDGQPYGYMTDMFVAAGMEPEVTMMGGGNESMDEHSENETEEEHGHDGFMVEVPAGDDEYTMHFTVTEDMVGIWEIGCFDQNGVHYTAGMVGSLTVIP